MANLVSWNPFHEIENVLNRYHRANDWLVDKGNSELTIPDWVPKVDIKENNDAYIIKAELPGIDKKDVSITLENNILTIRGEKRSQKDQENEKTHRIECSYGSFMRNFSLPESVHDEKVSASFKNGLLNLLIPKAPKAKQKSIDIKLEE